MSPETSYRGRRVLVTGGLGFIGSNLGRRLVELGAEVTLMDSMIKDYGGNAFNIADYKDKVRVNIADVRDRSAMDHLVQGQDMLFNLAGQVSHIDSMVDPFTDLEINCRSQLTVLEACRNHNPSVKVVFAGTRQVYGRPESLPVSEAQLVRPTKNNEAQAHSGQLTTSFMAPWARGYGVARMIAEAVENHARKIGLSVLNLDVRETQEAAITLYRSLGYHEIGRHEHYARVDGKFVAGFYFWKDLREVSA